MARIIEIAHGCSGSCVFVHANQGDVRALEDVFSVLTPQGWKSPEWLCNFAVDAMVWHARYNEVTAGGG